MKRVLLFFFILSSCAGFAQEATRGTIKGQKKLNIRSVHFDNINNRLVGKDHYGNVLDSAVVSFTVMVTIQGRAYAEDVTGTTLSDIMQQRLTRIDSGTTIFFSKIKVREKNGKIIDWPKFSAKLGYAFERDDN